jgi:hypothetical protein
MPCDRIQSVFPAQPGWRAELAASVGDPYSVAVVGWLVTDEGEAIPVLADGETAGSATTWEKGEYKLLPPDQQ